MNGLILVEPMHEENVGTALRSAHLLGVDVFVLVRTATKKRNMQILRQKSNTSKAHRSIPTFIFDTWSQFTCFCVHEKCPLIAVETHGKAILLPTFPHPRHAFYVFGNESTGLPERVLDDCDEIIRIPSVLEFGSYNLATACSIVMYERMNYIKRNGQGITK